MACPPQISEVSKAIRNAVAGQCKRGVPFGHDAVFMLKNFTASYFCGYTPIRITIKKVKTLHLVEKNA